jgi:uncharacterized protein (DUF4213/DUF364 family)
MPRVPRVEDLTLEGIEEDLVHAMLDAMERPDALVEQVVVGPKFIAVVAGGRMGMASLLGACMRPHEAGTMEGLIGQEACQVAENLKSLSPFAVCLGTAALNAANAPDPVCLPETDAPAEALIAELGRDRVVGLVGEFPFVSALKEQVGELHLFELGDVPGAVPRDAWDEALSGLDVLAVTGTAVLTRQMAYFLSRASRATAVVLGPTTPLSRALFRFGADHLCGSVFTEMNQVLEGVRSGISFRAMKKKGGIRSVRWDRENE